LPSVRQLARDLGIAPNTAARSYRELEQAGWIETRGGHGSFVSKPPDHPGTPLDLASDAARRFALSIRQLGVSPDRALDLVRRALNARPETF
jgi:DNA-binding transcriptional regulator YhcF (GntR family)